MEHEHERMLRRWIWRDFANITLGVWLAAYAFSAADLNRGMFWSDLLCGFVVVVLGTLTLWPRFDLLRWVICFTGIWLLSAPLVFWTRSPGAYANDTLVGALLIVFSVLLPMMPGRTHHAVMSGPGPDTPAGWTYNPSGWFQRGPLIAMAFVGFFLSRYLASYQLGHIPHPWDPFFGDGTRRVLDSEVSKAWPISDAGLGAVSYMLEALSGFMGGVNRWRTMPWMVLMFGVLVVPLGVVSIMLVVLQPVSVGAWCGLCLVTACAMLLMLSPALDEVIAMVQFLAGARREGKPLWRTFWVGGTLTAYAGDERPRRTKRSAVFEIVSALDLNNVPWNVAACAAIGMWLLVAPAALDIRGAAADSHYLTGALVVTFSVMGFSEVARSARLANLLLAAWIAATPWLMSDAGGAGWSAATSGAAIAALCIRRGRVETDFGAWNRWIV